MATFGKYYLIGSVFLLLFSMAGAVFLVKQNQNLQNLATPSCPSGKTAVSCNKTCNGGCVNAHCCAPGNIDCVDVPWEVDTCQPAGICTNLANRPDYECNNKSNCHCTSTCFWQSGGTCNEGCNQVTCDNGSGCTISCDKNGGPASCGTSTSPGGKNNDRAQGCPTSSGTTPAAGNKCPNDQSKTIKKYIKFTCPNGCTVTTEEGVTAARCYENRQESTSPLSLNGACGQIDALYGDTDSTYCGFTEYNCSASCQKTEIPKTPTKVPTNTPIPTKIPTKTPSVTPTKIPLRTSSSTPIPTKIPTKTPTATPTKITLRTSSSTPTPTPTPTTTIIISSPTPTPTSISVNSPTPIPTGVDEVDTPAPTVKPTSSPQFIAQGPTPTRIILPNAGVDFPIKGITIVGTIVTLLGLLLLL